MTILLGVHLAERAGSDREVLAERRNGPAVDIAGADDDAVGRLIDVMRDPGLAVAADMAADFLERAFLEQRGKALAGGQPALFMAGADFLRPAAGQDLGFPVP